MGFLLRWLFAFVLLAVTFNPTDLNYVRWASESWNAQTSVVVLVGLIWPLSNERMVLKPPR